MSATTADVIVIGGGVNGLGTAFRLVERGAGRVVVLERRYLAAGASGKSGALVRVHYTNEPESRLAHASLPVFQHWGDIIGGDCGWQNPGFVRIVAPADEAALRANVAMLQGIGVNTRLLDAAELRDLAPLLRTDDLTYAAYEPDSGYADPVATVYGFARRAAELGVEIRTGAEACAILTEGERVTGAELADGERLSAPVVVVAAGAWADRLLLPLGLDLGLLPNRVQVAIFRWTPPVMAAGTHPVVIDNIRYCWLRPEGRGTLIGLENLVTRTNPDDYDEGVDPDYVARCREALVNRLPALKGAPMRGGWAGMIMMSPDDKPIIDQLAPYAGLYCIAGDSGTSFKTAPAIGQAVAEWILDGAPRLVDLAPFSAARFANGGRWDDEHAYAGGQAHATISR